jgi:transcriptional regulator with XRE-family HTH domain
MTADLSVGQKLKDRRNEVDMTIRELARRTGLSASFISQVERGKANLSIDSLRQISECLDVSIQYLLSDGESVSGSLADEKPCEEQDLIAEYTPVVRAGCRPKLFFPTSGVNYEMLTNDLNHKMEPFMGRLSPGSGNVARRLRRNTEEFIYVLSGQLLVGLEEREYLLNPGDSIYFEGYQLQKIACASKAEDVVWISVITPPVF